MSIITPFYFWLKSFSHWSSGANVCCIAAATAISRVIKKPLGENKKKFRLTAWKFIRFDPDVRRFWPFSTIAGRRQKFAFLRHPLRWTLLTHSSLPVEFYVPRIREFFGKTVAQQRGFFPKKAVSFYHKGDQKNQLTWAWKGRFSFWRFFNI